MTKTLFPASTAILIIVCLAGCPGVDGDVDAGPEPEPAVCPDGERCVCETQDQDWPAPLNFEALDLFSESNCTKVRGAINLTPEMLLRASELTEIESALGLNLLGDFPAGTTLDELSFIQDLRSISVEGASGVTSLSGLQEIRSLDNGLRVDGAPDFLSIGMRSLRSIGIPNPGEEFFENAALLLVDLPSFETLDLPDDYALVSGPLVLKKLPRFDADEARALIAQFSDLPGEARVPEPGFSVPTEICELPADVGNNADDACPVE